MAHMILVLALSALMHTPGMVVHQDAGNERGVRIDFPGGTVAEYVEVLRRTYTQQDIWGIANIILQSDAEDFIMPAVQLRDVSVHPAVQLIAQVGLPSDGSSRRLIPNEIGGAYTVQAYGPAKRREPNTYRALAVGAVLEAGFTAEEVLTAIEQMLTLMGNDYEEPQLRFHEATGLLIARGHPDQIFAIESLVGQLMISADQRTASDQRDHISMEDTTMLKMRLESAQGQTQAAKREMVLMETRIEALQRELDRAHQTIERLEAQLYESRRQREGGSSPDRPQ